MQHTSYRLSNWSEYNKALINRFDINLWIPENIEDIFYADKANHKLGRPILYTDAAIEICLYIKSLYKLSYRATQGFLQAILNRAGYNIIVPSYTQIQRRAKQLKFKVKRPRKGVLDLVIDSTGLKVYGEGEWKVKKHGKEKRRVWKKLHLAVDPLDHEIMSYALTSHRTTDDKIFPLLMDHINERVYTCKADGAYDKKNCYEWCLKNDTELIVPPQINAKRSLRNPIKRIRNKAIKRIYELGGSKAGQEQWKKEVSYHERSLAETAMYRFKKLCGNTLYSRIESNQKTEVAIKINILNRFAKLGMPNSYCARK